MKKGIILETAVPVRDTPSDKSEMVNQLLFGELYELLEENEKWVHIRSLHDDYKGWIDKKQHSNIVNEPSSVSHCNTETSVMRSSYGSVRIAPGSLIPDQAFLKHFEFSSKIEEGSTLLNLREACQLYENAPYLWGGRTPFGIDCSGFTQLVYRLLGVKLPRDASQQVALGEQVSFVSESKEGDLAFFDNAEGRITHVGIIMGEEHKTIIHASGRVREDKIDHNGIYNEETKEYSHQLRTIKTIL